MRRTRGRKSHRERRTILVLAAIVCVLAVAVLWARSRDPEALRPPPRPPEMQARTAAPENAYHVLGEALYLLPAENPMPKKYPVPGRPGLEAFYSTEVNSIARELDIWAPDDGPEVAAYLEQCQPAIEKARQALACPYFLIPQEAGQAKSAIGDPAFTTLLHASCRHAWEIRNDKQTALDLFFDAVRLCRLLRQDGAANELSWIQLKEQNLWRQLADYVKETGDPAILNHALDRLMELEEPPPLDWNLILDAEWRSEWEYLERMRAQGSLQGPATLANVLRMRHERRMIRSIINKGGIWTQTLSLPYPRFEEALGGNPGGPLAAAKDYGGCESVWYRLWEAKLGQTCCAAMQRQLLLLALLELHRLDKGQYPEALAGAAAGRLEMLPVDPFTEEQFQYNPLTPERLLVSPGPKTYPRSLFRPDLNWRAEIVNGVVGIQTTPKED
ncbi:MAG TPA: hypothetical protein PLJ71_05265 [Candidatus Hydrogenedentes bacterium]|nr:hypothetical protein [Candidatus Hydrogenedentota bacterium]